MSAVGGGVLPETGFTYANLFLFYARDELRGPGGELLATGHNSVLMDMNIFTWASDTTTRRGRPRYAISVTLPIANNSLASDTEGALSGGGGFADSFYQPAILGWSLSRADLKVAYGFLAPTGRFKAGAADNVGSGYWTQSLSAGQSIYMTPSRATTLSAFEMVEFHSTQAGTHIDPGDNVDLDYSLMQRVASSKDMRLQLGLVGYAQWQTTDTHGPMVTPEQASAHYRVYALGFGSNLNLPARRVTLALRYFDELFARSTLQGNSIQISSTIGF